MLQVVPCSACVRSLPTPLAFRSADISEFPVDWNSGCWLTCLPRLKSALWDDSFLWLHKHPDLQLPVLLCVAVAMHPIRQSSATKAHASAHVDFHRISLSLQTTLSSSPPLLSFSGQLFLHHVPLLLL